MNNPPFSVPIQGAHEIPTQIMTTPRSGNLEQQVLTAEDAYVKAEIHRDEATLRRLIDDRFVHSLSNGKTNGKDEFIQAVLKMPMVGQTIRERTVLIEGDVALVFGTTEIQFKPPGGEASVSNLRYTATYVNRQGQWRMLALQMQARSD